MNTMRKFAQAIIIIGIAATAWAVTAGELEERASALSGTYTRIADAAAACPAGACAEAATIRADAAAADADLGLLHQDRAALDPCSTCADLDLKIASVDRQAEEVTQIIKGWDEQG